ncbi:MULTISPECIES: hypothetical protein [unclassified Pseudomonas]|uniref:hypothetical protein n=1 Tax=unclassified Pseudomonas TaxID=196821 RepID=UPI000BD7B284|nr:MULTISPECIES: hypothetical protein [unclassified Pseudomonas]PVZ12425.1 hypothetical protein F474_03220 [Pseudomonas sp. URIL14HWK12:I12]PVZ23423.1 hypothetical protein F470_02982 [Pseudomonas sp. URIL14HWK12:I10]PVZ32753.1 hypothetical protein F472_03330 [Pseudomonas sp. URIL14HWK12:I11]SNZ13985.1 hypothetical protein SAMN05660463_02679 [Pseudomonas sp. URIL14HWK12:I9]
MNDMSIITNTLGRFANNMRLYGEAFLRYRGLVEVDREEAIHNLDRAFEQNLEGFHTLYDVSQGVFDFHVHADTSLLIAIRNAIHHRNHPLFHSLLQTLWLDEEPERLLGAEYLMARHRTLGGNPPPMMHLIKLEDIYSRLDPRYGSIYMNQMGKATSLARFIAMEDAFAFEKIHAKALKDHYPMKQVYLDLMPIFNSAVSKVFTALDMAGVPFQGFDANAYKSTFIEELKTDLQHYDFFGLRMNAMQVELGPRFTIQQASTKRGCTYEKVMADE